MKFSAVALLGALVVGISGCSSSDADEIADGRVTTIDHKFGATTITGTPTRIVAADTQWLDVLLELGIQPVGYLSAGTMGDERGLFRGKAAWTRRRRNSIALRSSRSVSRSKRKKLQPWIPI